MAAMCARIRNKFKIDKKQQVPVLKKMVKSKKHII